MLTVFAALAQLERSSSVIACEKWRVASTLAAVRGPRASGVMARLPRPMTNTVDRGSCKGGVDVLVARAPELLSEHPYTTHKILAVVVACQGKPGQGVLHVFREPPAVALF